MASKLNFRARTLDAGKPMAIYHAEELPELTDLNAINRSVPAMPSGMEKEEESEKHLQDILDAQSNATAKGGAGGDTDASHLVIPTPEVFEGSAQLVYKDVYVGNYKIPRPYIHVQPFSTDNDLPDYDLDEEDCDFLQRVLKDEKKFEVDESTFEGMLDRLEKNSGHSVIEVQEAKSLLQEDDELILAVYDYWVDKRLRLKHPLMPLVKSDKRDFGQGGTGPGPQGSQSGGGGGNSSTSQTTATNPYIAFRRRTEKMQTRKNRKNDEVSYEKMLKLRRDLNQAIVLLEMVKRREKTKKELLTLTAEIFERRYQAGDFEGKVFEEVVRAGQSAHHNKHLLAAAMASAAAAQGGSRVLTPRFPQDFWMGHPDLAPPHMATGLPLEINMKERKRHHSKKARKQSKKDSLSRRLGHHQMALSHAASAPALGGMPTGPEFGTAGLSSDDDFGLSSVTSGGGGGHSDLDTEDEQEGHFAFRRKKNCQYLRPLDPSEMERGFQGTVNNLEQAGLEPRSNPKSRYVHGSLATPNDRYLGLIRRRVGRGGRIVIDRIHSSAMTPSVNNIFDPFDDPDDELRPSSPSAGTYPDVGEPVFRPVTPPHFRDDWPDENVSPFAVNAATGSRPAPALDIKVTNNSAIPSTSSSSSYRQRHSGGFNVRPVPVDSVGARNAASAVVTSDMMDIFNSYTQN